MIKCQMPSKKVPNDKNDEFKMPFDTIPNHEMTQ